MQTFLNARLCKNKLHVYTSYIYTEQHQIAVIRSVKISLLLYTQYRAFVSFHHTYEKSRLIFECVFTS